MKKYAIKMEQIGKDYGRVRVLDGLNLLVEKGKTVFLFGENGSGKTSLLKIAASLARPTRGAAATSGFDICSQAEMVRKKTGLVSHEDCLYENLSAFENLRFFCELQRVDSPAQRAKEMIEIFEIANSQAPSGSLSAGMKKRISIARALSHKPETLLFDEPYSGLDRRAAAIFSDTLENLKRCGKTALITTHLISEGLAHSDFTALLCGGQIAFYENSGDLNAAKVEAEFEKIRKLSSAITRRRGV